MTPRWQQETEALCVLPFEKWGLMGCEPQWSSPEGGQDWACHQPQWEPASPTYTKGSLKINQFLPRWQKATEIECGLIWRRDFTYSYYQWKSLGLNANPKIQAITGYWSLCQLSAAPSPVWSAAHLCLPGLQESGNAVLWSIWQKNRN